MKWMSRACLGLIVCSVYAGEEPFLDAVSAGVGQSQDDIDIYRFGLRKDSECRWLANRTGWLSVYYEASLNYWRRRSEDIYGVAFSPVYIYTFGHEKNKNHPYIEGGIGIAGIEDTEIGNRNMTTAFQFEDRIGVGVRVEKVDLSFRYMHYSNGSIEQPNDGIDILIFTAGYRF